MGANEKVTKARVDQEKPGIGSGNLGGVGTGKGGARRNHGAIRDKWTEDILKTVRLSDSAVR